MFREEQLQLFPGLEPPAPLPCPRKKPKPRRKKRLQRRSGRRPRIAQTDFWGGTLDDYPTQRITKAKGKKLPRTLGYSSVWDLAAAGERPKSLGTFAPEAARKVITRAVRTDGVTRVYAVQEQETQEWQDKEQARRARQRPPKPQKQRFKMRNSRTWADGQS
ncbi:hypothetical protein [Xylophilus sp. GOD-11R]|uniref:hypothetical protein n=1 Tax=Xylophilus sp. GOD-11R TaxID=3089814 RepID=UPI00298D3B5E|nr:hypothetical protein [Xylophilus sp. GOD-11R]WPB58624.1 hypothetical protein R9X41_08310 [Xylophilus sp. GOD-11R]